jgi:acyl-CoA thioester hydrolase
MTEQAFPVRVTLPVAWGQLDAFGHVNNTQFFRFFEDARIACFEQVGMGAHMRDHGVGPILAKTDCVFRQPLGFPDTVTACTRITDLGVDRFTMAYAVFSAAKGLAAHGSGRIVMLDYGTGAKVPIPDPIRSALEALR